MIAIEIKKVPFVEMGLFCYSFWENYLRTNGGNNFEETSPKPILTCPFLQKPFMITVSLSLMNLRSVPSFKVIGFLPPQVNSKHRAVTIRCRS